MQRNVITGSEFVLYDIHQQPVAYSKNCALSLKQSLIDISTKDSDSWNDSMAGNRDWNISFDGLVSYNDKFDAGFFTDKMLSGEPFFIKFGVVQANFDYSYWGEVVIESISLNSKLNDVCSYEGKLVGVGDLKSTNEGSPEQNGYLKVETDPIFRGSPAFSITNQNKTNWNEANSKIIQSNEFSTSENRVTLTTILKDGSKYTSGFNYNLTGYYNKNQTDTKIATAQEAADTANQLLLDIAADYKLSAGEKPNVLKEWQIISDEKPKLEEQAVTYGVEILEYDISFTELDIYLKPLLVDLSVTSDIVPIQFRSFFRKYYDQKILLLKAISEATKTYVDNIQFGLRNYFINGDRSKFINSVVPELLQEGNFLLNSEFALSFLAKSTSNTLLTLYFEGRSGVEFIIDGEWRRYSGVFKTGDSSKLFSFIPISVTSDQSFPYSMPVNLNYGIEMKDIMIVAGNKPIDFTHAPEDFYDLISSAKHEAILVSNDYAEAQKKLAITTANAYGKITDVEQIQIDLANQNLVAIKAYSDSQDLYSRTIAAAYADGKITAEEQKRINAVQSSLDASKAYAEAQKQLAVVTSNAFADGIVTAEEARAIADAQLKLATAKAYAEAQAAKVRGELIVIIDNSIAVSTSNLIAKYTAAINVANTAALNSAQADATNKADAAKAASILSAKTYTNAQAAYEREVAIANADGKITQEERARIFQAQNNLEAAKADATNKANAAAAYGQAATDLHNALIGNLRDLAYQDVVEVGKLGTTIVSGGYIKGTLLDVEYIKASIINAEYINALVTTSNTLQTSASGKRIVISGLNNNMIFYDQDNHESLRIDSNIDSGQAGNPLGGLKMNTPAGDTAYCSGNGFFANGSGMQFLSSTVGVATNASVVGLLRYRNSDSSGISAAVVGVDQSTGGSSKSYAGYFNGKVKITNGIEVSTGQEGINATQDIRVGGDAFYRMTWVNGLLVSSTRN